MYTIYAIRKCICAEDRSHDRWYRKKITLPFMPAENQTIMTGGKQFQVVSVMGIDGKPYAVVDLKPDHRTFKGYAKEKVFRETEVAGFEEVPAKDLYKVEEQTWEETSATSRQRKSRGPRKT